MKKINTSDFLVIKSNMITNFKPQVLSNFNDLNSFKKNKCQIFCKNFFIYILLLKFKNNVFFQNNIFVKKYKKKVYTILRSPYRHKLARHQIMLNRYYVNISIFIKIKNKINIKNWSKLIFLMSVLNKFSDLFESNLIFLNSFLFSFPVNYTTNFRYKLK